MKYERRGREIYTDKGKLAATLDDSGNPIMAVGMAGPHTKGVKEFLALTGTAAEPEPAAVVKQNLTTDPEPAPETPQEDGNCSVFVGSVPIRHVAPDHSAPEKPMSKPEWQISTIPVRQLPKFDKELGCYTPGFREYVKKYQLTDEEVTALVRRLEQLEPKEKKHG